MKIYLYSKKVFKNIFFVSSLKKKMSIVNRRRE